MFAVDSLQCKLSSKLLTSNNFQLGAHSQYFSPPLHFSPAEHLRPDLVGSPSGPPSSGAPSYCINWASDWSPCSRSCGPGVSTRSTNRNRACRLQTETRLCQVRPCRALAPGLWRLQLVGALSTRFSCNQESVVCEYSFKNNLSTYLITLFHK